MVRNINYGERDKTTELKEKKTMNVIATEVTNNIKRQKKKK